MKKILRQPKPHLPKWARTELKAYREFYEGIKADTKELEQDSGMVGWLLVIVGGILIAAICLSGISCHVQVHN